MERRLALTCLLLTCRLLLPVRALYMASSLNAGAKN